MQSLKQTGLSGVCCWARSCISALNVLRAKGLVSLARAGLQGLQARLGLDSPRGLSLPALHLVPESTREPGGRALFSGSGPCGTAPPWPLSGSLGRMCVWNGPEHGWGCREADTQGETGNKIGREKRAG